MHEIEEDTLLDYVNGHLSGQRLDDVENALKNDPALREKLNETKAWHARSQQLKMQQADTNMPEPQFSGIEHKLKRSKFQWHIAMPTAAVVALVAVLYVNTSDQLGLSGAPNNEFETLTDAVSQYKEPVLQIVLNDNVDMHNFANEFNLNVVQSYPGTQIIDVKLTESVKQRLTLLQSDARVILIKQVGQAND